MLGPVHIRQAERPRLPDLGTHQIRQRRRQYAVVALHVELEVEPQAARIPVGGTLKRPKLLDQQQLGMIERRGRQPDAAATLQHLPQKCRRRPLHQSHVVLRRQDDIDLDASQGGHVQGGNQRRVGQEIGRDDQQRRPRAASNPTRQTAAVPCWHRFPWRLRQAHIA